MKNFLLLAGEAGKQTQNISWKIPFNLAAEPRSGEAETLTFPYWLRILKLVRTFFAACGGEGKPQ